VVKGSLSVNLDGDLQVLELLETSRTTETWCAASGTIVGWRSCSGQDGRSFQIKGLPIRAHVSGPVFQKHYSEVRARLGDVDLAAVWIIRPDEILDEPGRAAERGTSRPSELHAPGPSGPGLMVS